MAQGVLFQSFLTHAPGKALFATGSRKSGVSLTPIMSSANLRFGGGYKVTGTTKVAGAPDVPVSRKVRLYHLRSAAVLANECWSGQDGAYEFLNLEKGPWFVVAHDHTGEYNAVIADNIDGAPM